MARLAIAEACLAEYAKLDKHVQRAVDQAITTFARHPHPGQHLERPRNRWDDRIRLLPVDGLSLSLDRAYYVSIDRSGLECLENQGV